MAITLASPLCPNAGIFRRTKNSFTQVATKNKWGGNRRCLVADGVGVKTVTLGRHPTGPLPARKGTHAFKGAGPSEVNGDKFSSTLLKLLELHDVIQRFMRLHVVYMVLIGFAGVMTRTWMQNSHLVKIPKWILLCKGIALFLGLLCADSFTSGINQIYDFEIDKINKPDLPLVSGEIKLDDTILTFHSSH